MDLHYSQTTSGKSSRPMCFTTLWIYTILKRELEDNPPVQGFTTLWIYTILKLLLVVTDPQHSFTTLWIYTILKQ